MDFFTELHASFLVLVLAGRFDLFASFIKDHLDLVLLVLGQVQTLKTRRKSTSSRTLAFRLLALFFRMSHGGHSHSHHQHQSQYDSTCHVSTFQKQTEVAISSRTNIVQVFFIV